MSINQSLNQSSINDQFNVMDDEATVALSRLRHLSALKLVLFYDRIVTMLFSIKCRSYTERVRAEICDCNN